MSGRPVAVNQNRADSMEKKTFKPEIESLVKIQAYVKEGIRKHTDADQNWFKLDLVIEELVVNIISYGMKDIESGGYRSWCGTFGRRGASANFR